jgi:hypothetical protein
VTRRTDHQGTTTTRTWVILQEGSHEGRPVFRGAVAGTVVMYDKATRSYVATLREGKLAESFSPHTGTYSWPLQVGKLDDETRTNSTSTGAYVVAECSNAAER